jgi:hypothetical protein
LIVLRALASEPGVMDAARAALSAAKCEAH